MTECLAVDSKRYLWGKLDLLADWPIWGSRHHRQISVSATTRARCTAVFPARPRACKLASFVYRAWRWNGKRFLPSDMLRRDHADQNTGDWLVNLCVVVKAMYFSFALLTGLTCVCSPWATSLSSCWWEIRRRWGWDRLSWRRRFHEKRWGGLRTAFLGA